MNFKNKAVNYFVLFFVITFISSCSYIKKLESNLGISDKEKKSQFPITVAIPSKNPVEVRAGILLPLSGKYSSIGRNMFDAAQLAVYELKSGNLKLEAIDIGSDQESAIEALKNYDASKLDLLLGPIFSDQVPAAYDFAKKNNLITLSYTNDISLAHQPGLYLLGVIPEEQAVRVSSYAGKVGFSNIYMISSDDQFSNSIEDALVSNSAPLDYTVRKVEKYTSSQIKPIKGIMLSSAVVSIKNSIMSDVKNYIPGFGRPGVLLPEGGAKLKKIAQQLNLVQEGQEKKYKLLGIGDWGGYNLMPNSMYDGALVADIPHYVLKQYYNRFYEYYKYKPIRISALAYDSITLIAAIINVTDSSIILDFDQLQNSNGYRGVTGIFRLMPNGKNERKFSIYEMKRGEMKMIENAPNYF